MKKRIFEKFMKKKLAILFVSILLVFLILVGVISKINASDGDKYKKIVLDNQEFSNQPIAFKRGDILDRNGTRIATSERVYNVILDAKVLLGKEEYKEPTLEVLEKVFEIPKEEVEEKLEANPGSSYQILKKDISYEVATQFNEIVDDTENNPYVKGVWLEDDYIRSYPYNTLACSTIGFVVDGNVGSNGIEAYYNDILNGINGRRYGYQDEEATFNRTMKEPINGKNVVTTIDVQIQSIVDKYVRDFNEANKDGPNEGGGSKNTGVIVMNPQNGEILAMSTYPSYDLNNPRDLSSYYTEEELKGMDEEEKTTKLNGLWNNFCVNTPFEPGSTFKPFPIAVALDKGVLSGDEIFHCSGSLNVGGFNITCYGGTAHGTETLKQVMENSCNVGLMQIAQKLERENMVSIQEQFGFGEFNNIDLPGEEQGLLYTVDNMDDATLATNGFGQNFTVTMNQLASGFCSLINGGDYYKPHVVKQIQNEDGTVTENIEPILLKKTISKETSELVKDYLRGVVTDGTGKAANIEGYDIGGKTGTAEKLPRGNGKHVQSFIGYAPQDNPEVLVYVVIDEPNVGSQSSGGYATIMAGQIMEEIFPYLGIQRTH